MSDGFPLERSAQEYVRERLAGHAPDEIVQRCWDVFYSVYTRTLQQFARNCGVPSTDHDDFIQDVWLTVVRQLPALRFDANRGGLRTWLYVVVRRRAANLARGRPANEQPLRRSETDRLPSPERSPAEEYEREWEWCLLHSLLDALRARTNARSFQVFRLRRLEGRRLAEIAQVTGLTEGQVRGRLRETDRRFHALSRLLSGDPLCVGGDES